MRTLILYCSKSLGNTKKLVDAIAQAHPGEVDAIDATALPEDGSGDPDLSAYGLVGLASGVYDGAFDGSVTSAAARCLHGDELVFALSTSSSNDHDCRDAVRELCHDHGALMLGAFGCTGADARGGAHRLVRGLSRKHPNEKDLQGAVEFYDSLVSRLAEMDEEAAGAGDDAAGTFSAEVSPGEAGEVAAGETAPVDAPRTDGDLGMEARAGAAGEAGASEDGAATGDGSPGEAEPRAPVGEPAGAAVASAAGEPAAGGPEEIPMRTLIIYCSKSQGNTKRLVDAIQEAHPGEVETIDATTLGKNATLDLSPYLLVGLASGIYHSHFDKSVVDVFSASAHDGDNIFTMMTYGTTGRNCADDIRSICRLKGVNYLGAFGCNGYSDIVPFKFNAELKGHPMDEEVEGAVTFYDELVERYGDKMREKRAKRDEREERDAERAAERAGRGIFGGAKGAARKAADGTARREKE